MKRKFEYIKTLIFAVFEDDLFLKAKCIVTESASATSAQAHVVLTLS